RRAGEHRGAVRGDGRIPGRREGWTETTAERRQWEAPPLGLEPRTCRLPETPGQHPTRGVTAGHEMGTLSPIPETRPSRIRGRYARVPRMRVTDLIATYCDALTASGRSPGTIRLHRHYLRQLPGHPLTMTTGDLV